MIKFIKKILHGFVESWAGFKEDEHIEMYNPVNHCEDHSKYKHRCPKCNPKVKEYWHIILII